MIHMLVHIPDSHVHSARELKIILLRDWPVEIEEYNEAQGFYKTRSEHRCSSCDPEYTKE